MNATARFSIRFDSWYRTLSSLLLLSPSRSYVEIADGQVHVRMAWAFRASFPCSSLVRVAVSDHRPTSRGVHGMDGRWLVNGSGSDIVAMDLNPIGRGYVMGFQVRLRQLLVSVEDPEGLVRLLAPLGSYSKSE